MPPLGYSAYKRTTDQATNDKEKILIMLLDGAIRFTRFARKGLEKGSPKFKGENLSKVLAIISELECALDESVDKELTAHLASLYQYMILRLTEANINNEIKPLEEVEQLLIQIKDGFDQVVKKNKAVPKVVNKNVEEELIEQPMKRFSLAA